MGMSLNVLALKCLRATHLSGFTPKILLFSSSDSSLSTYCSWPSESSTSPVFYLSSSFLSQTISYHDTILHHQNVLDHLNFYINSIFIIIWLFVTGIFFREGDFVASDYSLSKDLFFIGLFLRKGYFWEIFLNSQFLKSVAATLLLEPVRLDNIDQSPLFWS